MGGVQAGVLSAGPTGGPPRADPTGPPPRAVPGLDRLADLVCRGGVAVLSGAGLSTESGIPDYRGPTGARRRATPMAYRDFVADPQARRRYWARSHLGWARIAAAWPNAGHRAVAQLERDGLVCGVVTQNVDGLHQAAGTTRVVDLHGSLARVVCLGCRAVSLRRDLAARLAAANRGWRPPVRAVHPDGDVDLADGDLDGFRYVDCARCGGTLKPDVVFFGEAVPPQRVAAAYGVVDAARLLLVLGSSLTVLSGRRFVLHAVRQDIPVAIVNRGATRADAHACLTVDAPLGQALPALLAALPPRMKASF